MVHHLDNLSDEFYILDENKDAHYIYIEEIVIYKSGKMKLEYKSSSDLETRGLMPILEEAIIQRYWSDV